MQKLFSLLPVLMLVSILVAWSFPLLALGVRFDLWGFMIALPLLAGAALTAAIIMALAGVALLASLRRKQQSATHRAMLVILILVVPVGTVFHFGLKAGQAPVLYDVSTDWEHPPAIAVLSGVRPEDANELQVIAETKALQQQNYPDLQPLTLAMPPAGAMELVKRVAESMGWQIEMIDPATGILEATDRTFWFGFVDDIAVRVRPDQTGQSRVDIRSASRVGKSDLGKNAERIRAFRAALTP